MRIKKVFLKSLTNFTRGNGLISLLALLASSACYGQIKYTELFAIPMPVCTFEEFYKNEVELDALADSGHFVAECRNPAFFNSLLQFSNGLVKQKIPRRKLKNDFIVAIGDHLYRWKSWVFWREIYSLHCL